MGHPAAGIFLDQHFAPGDGNYLQTAAEVAGLSILRLMPDRFPLGGGHYAPEPEVVRSCIEISLAACADHVARAVLIGAEEGASSMDLFRVSWFRGVIG